MTQPSIPKDELYQLLSLAVARAGNSATTVAEATKDLLEARRLVLDAPEFLGRLDSGLGQYKYPVPDNGPLKSSQFFQKVHLDGGVDPVLGEKLGVSKNGPLAVTPKNEVFHPSGTLSTSAIKESVRGASPPANGVSV